MLRITPKSYPPTKIWIPTTNETPDHSTKNTPSAQHCQHSVTSWISELAIFVSEAATPAIRSNRRSTTAVRRWSPKWKRTTSSHPIRYPPWASYKHSDAPATISAFMKEPQSSCPPTSLREAPRKTSSTASNRRIPTTIAAILHSTVPTRYVDTTKLWITYSPRTQTKIRSPKHTLRFIPFANAFTSRPSRSRASFSQTRSAADECTDRPNESMFSFKDSMTKSARKHSVTTTNVRALHWIISHGTLTKYTADTTAVYTNSMKGNRSKTTTRTGVTPSISVQPPRQPSSRLYTPSLPLPTKD